MSDMTSFPQHSRGLGGNRLFYHQPFAKKPEEVKQQTGVPHQYNYTFFDVLCQHSQTINLKNLLSLPKIYDIIQPYNKIAKGREKSWPFARYESGLLTRE